MVNKDDNIIVKLKILKTPIKNKKPIKKVKTIKNDIDNINK